MEQEQLKDDFLKNLLKSGEAEKPRLDFTARVMQDIQQLEAEKARNPLWTWGNILIAAGVLVTLILVYFVVTPFFGEFKLFSEGIAPERYGQYLNMILSSFQGFLSLIEFLRESTITLIVLVVIPSLYLLDLLLKRAGSRTYLFIF
jgi:glycopeptide antibiotics resistance protein